MKGDGSVPEWADLLGYCVVSRSSALNVSADTNVSWNQETDDPGNWHLNATNPQRITPGVAGVYIFWSMCHATSGDLMRVKIMLNNTTAIGAMRGGNVGGYEAWVTALSYPVALGATDYANVLCDCNGLTGSLQTDSFFAAMRIR
jgi:hypothetical protein